MPVIYNVTVDEEGVLNKLDTLLPFTMSQIENATYAVAEEAIRVFKDYPPETEANEPPPPYYERGVGYYGRTGKLTKPSEQLDQRWGFEVNRMGDEMVTATVENTASYAAYVHGDEEQLQMPWHAARGWPNALATISAMVGDPEATGLSGARGPSISTRVRNAFSGIAERVASWFNR